MRLFLRVIFYALLGILSAQQSWAGAWTVPERKWEIYQSANAYKASYYRDAQGNRINQDSYNKIESDTRIEYGLEDDLTLGVNFQLAAVLATETFTLPSSGFLPATSVDVRRWNYGIADPRLYARKRLWQDDTSLLSSQATLKLPGLFRYTNLPRSGSDEFSYEARLLAGHNFELAERTHFSNIEAAYEWRPHNDGDLVHLDGTVGFNLTDDFILLPQLFTSWGTGNSNRQSFTQTGNDTFDLVKPQLSGVFTLNETTQLQAGIFHNAYVRNTGGGSGLTLSFWIKP